MKKEKEEFESNKRIQITVRSDLYPKYKQFAEERGVSFAALCRIALGTFVKNNGGFSED